MPLQTDLLFLVIRDPQDEDLETFFIFEISCIYLRTGTEERVGIIDGNQVFFMNCKTYTLLHL